jgi:hypothetical protein
VSESIICRLLKRLGWSRKKITGCERDEWLRAYWRTLVTWNLDARRLVFVDEMGTNISLPPIYAWAPKGERAPTKVPCNRGPNTTLLASMTAEGMGPCLALVGSTTRQVFEASTSGTCSRLRYDPGR